MTRWVVKLGGSLAYCPNLRGWLEVIVARGRERVVIVPGGGPFADQVRAAQRHWRFDEATAHRMAILGMHQYGWLLAGLNGRLRPMSDPGGGRHGEVPVWLPVAETLQEWGVEPSWDFTSDSLAACLAAQLGAEHLILVKSAALPAGPLTAAELARSDIVDEALPGLLGRSGFATWLYHRDDSDAFARALETGSPAGQGALAVYPLAADGPFPGPPSPSVSGV